MPQSLRPEGFKLEIRVAQLCELDSLTEVHLAAFKPEDNIPVLLGRRYVRAVYRWLVTSKQTYTRIAVAQDKLLGLVAVADISFTKPMFKACLPEFLRSLALRPSLFFKKRLWHRFIRGERGATQLGRRISMYPGVAQLPIVAVEKEFRGLDIFPALIEAAKKRSRSRGSRAIRAGVYKVNKASRRAFEKVGWIEAPELETVDLVFYITYLDPNLAEELGVREKEPA